MMTNRRTPRGHHQCSASSPASRQFHRTFELLDNRDLIVLRAVPSPADIVELFIRNLDPILDKASLSSIVGKGDWGTVLHLGNIYLLTGCIHKKLTGFSIPSLRGVAHVS